MSSTTGVNRNSYTHYENSFNPRLVNFSSADGNNPDITHKHRNSNYMISVKDVECRANQILTAYVHNANIPTTFYQINRFNDTSFLYLPDWESVYFHPTEKGGSRYNSLDKGVIPIILSRRNYTNSQLKIEIQKQLDAITTTYKVSFDSAYNTASMSNTNAQTDVPTYFKCKVLTKDLLLNSTSLTTIADQTTVQFTNIKSALPEKDITYSSTKYKFNNAVTTIYPDPTGNTTRPSRSWYGIGTDSSNTTEEVWVLSEARYDVKIENNGKIRIDSID